MQTTYVELLAADYEALADAIRSPMGVVPDSAAGLVDATDLQREIIESAKAVLAVVDRKTDAVDRLKAAIAAAGG